MYIVYCARTPQLPIHKGFGCIYYSLPVHATTDPVSAELIMIRGGRTRRYHRSRYSGCIIATADRLNRINRDCSVSSRSIISNSNDRRLCVTTV